MKKTKLVALSLVLALILNMMMPLMTVIAASSYTITFTATGTHTLENDNGHLKIDGQYVDLKDSSNNTIGEVTVSGSTGSITVTDGIAGQLNYNSNNLFTLYNTDGHTPYNMGTELSSNVEFMVENYDEGGSTDGEDINVSFTFTGTTGEVRINDKRAGGETDSWSGTVENAGYTDSSKTNKIYVTTSFGSPKFSKITINGVDYNFTDNADEHMIEVAGATSYTINATADSNIAQDRTIIWGNPGATSVNDEDDVLENGSARIIAVYNQDGNLVNEEDYTGPGHKYGLDEDNNGWANVIPGSKVVFEFVPDYGYQLTKVLSNGMELEPQNKINQYEFIMPDADVHFDATFTKTDDVVKAESDKVSSGSIDLGNTLEGGSAQLSVSDVTLSSDKIKGFEDAAGDYTISNYLNIDLYNVFYKGKDDSEDVWSNKISELDNEATISLKLADGITADDIVIVHNIHDGEEYEVIEIDSYDPETNTITFKTKSFSNYAIATKTATTTEATKTSTTTEETKTTETSSNPTTGDNIITITIIFVIATLGAFTTIKLNKNFKIRKH